jgi:hypothetical protein
MDKDNFLKENNEYKILRDDLHSIKCFYIKKLKWNFAK